MKPYGVDLCERIVVAVEQKGWNQAEAAEVFGVSEASRLGQPRSRRARPGTCASTMRAATVS